jgi:molecular chaperone DnaK
MVILTLGGDDFDQVIIDWLADEFKADAEHGLAQRPNGFATFERSWLKKRKLNLSSSTRNRYQPCLM